MRRDYPFRNEVNELLKKESRWEKLTDKEGIDLIFLDLHEIAGVRSFLRLDEHRMMQKLGVKEPALLLELGNSGKKSENDRGPRSAYVVYPDYQCDHIELIAASDLVVPRSHEELEVLVEIAHKRDCKIKVHPKERSKYLSRDVRVLLPVNDYNHRPQIGELNRVDKAYDEFCEYQRTVDARIRSAR